MQNTTSLCWAMLALTIACSGTIDDAALDPGAAPASGPPRPSAGTTAPATGVSPGRGQPPGAALGASPVPPPVPMGRPAAECGALSPSARPPRRLNRFEYENTVRALLAEPSFDASALPTEDRLFGFDNNVGAQATSELLVEAHFTLAERVAGRAVERLQRLVGCDPMVGGEACVRAFVQSFGGRAYRRPLDAPEVARLMAVYTAGRATDAATGVKMVLQVMLMSPHFLYRVERDPPAAWDLASRLSYLLWGSMPDAELFAAAQSGVLVTRAGVAAQTGRMLADSRALPVVARFHRQWLGLDGAPAPDKDAKLFPTYNEGLWALLQQETDLTLSQLGWGGGGTLDAILSSRDTFLNRALATFYGVTGPMGTAFERVTLDAQKRSGVVTAGALMAMLAKPNQTSPIARGVFVREQLLCQNLPAPPNDVEIKPPEPDPKRSTRERFAQHRESPSCGGCHVLIDPIGFGLESFDGVGRERSRENGQPIDARGDLTGTDVDGPFEGATALTTRLAASATARRCYVTQWFRFAHGRSEGPADRCSLAQATAAFETSGRNVQALVRALTQTEAFVGRAGGLL